MVALNKTCRKTLTPDRSAKDSGLRFYSPEISRWLSRDPIGPGYSLYHFVANEPVGAVDLLGLAEQSLGKCQQAVNEEFAANTKLKELYDKLLVTNSENPPNPRCIVNWYCDCCPESHKGVYFWESKAQLVTTPQWQLRTGMMIKICWNRHETYEDMKCTLRHEMQHAAEYCYQKKASDCKESVCGEARASFCSGLTDQKARKEAQNSAKKSSLCIAPSEQEKIAGYASQCVLKKTDCYVAPPDLQQSN